MFGFDSRDAKEPKALAPRNRHDQHLAITVDAAKVGTILRYVFQPDNYKHFTVWADGDQLIITRKNTGQKETAQWRITISDFQELKLPTI